jgi:RHS repeat-associated protein
VKSIYTGSPGVANLAAQTQYTYDGGSLVVCLQQSCPSVYQHDSSYGTSWLTRGNATSISQLLNDSVNNFSNVWLTTSQTFDIAGNLLTSIDPRGVQQQTSYTDSSGFYALPMTKSYYTGLAGNNTNVFTDTFTYDFNIQKPISYTDFNSQTTTYAYADPTLLDRLTNITHPDGGQTNFTFQDIVGSFYTKTAQDKDTPGDGAIVSQIDYDGLGRKSQTWYAAPEGDIETCYAYDGKNRLASVSNPNNGSCSSLLTSYSYDVLDRKTTVTAQDNSVTKYFYSGDTTKLTNDTLEIEPPLPGQTNGNNRLDYVDGLGRLRGVTENVISWMGGTYGQSGQTPYGTSYNYDVLDDLTSVTQGTESRTFTYDTLKRLVKSVNPESGIFTFLYDNSGNLQTRTDPRLVPGTSTPFQASYAYDGMNRLTGKSYNDGAVQSPYLPTPPVTLTYDQYEGIGYSLGRLTQSQAGCFAYSWIYDMMGRPFSSTESVPTSPLTTAVYCDNNQGAYMGTSFTMYYGYNLASDLTSFIYPSGRVALTNYDTANRISQVQDVYNGNTSTHAGSINYWPNRVIENMNIGHQNSNNVNLVENTTLNSRLQISARNAQFGSTFPVQFSFTYGAAGNNNGNLTAQQIQTIAAPNPPCVGAPPCTVTPIPALNLTQNYTYDAYDRILSATETGGTSEWTQNYLYDQWGNRAVQTGSYMPNPNGTPTALTQFTNNQWLGTGASYDAAGDATGVPGSTSETFTYDAENRVNTANANGTITYIYDGEGRRVEKTSSTFSTIYLYDAAGEVAVETTVPVTGTSFPTDAPVTGTEYLVEDHLGSTRLSMDSQGQVVRRYDFLPFGEEIVAGVGGRGADYEPSNYVYPTTPDDVLHKFTGKERDAETGLDFFGARYMSSAQGRFTSPDYGGPLSAPDPVPWADFENPQTLNLYSYGHNSPMSNVDDDGHDVNVCLNDESGNSHCTQMSNEQYEVASQGNGSLNVPTLDQVGMNGNGNGSFNATNITDSSGNSLGTATYVSNGGADYYANRNGINALAQVGATMNDPRTYALWFGASALAGGGLVAAGATSGEFTLLGDIALTPTSGEVGYAERLLAQGGKKAVEKAIRTLAKRLAEHQAKVGGLQYPATVQREIATFTRAIEALRSVLR